MELEDLVRAILNFAKASHAEKIKVFGWYLHARKGMERFNQADIRGCYDRLHYAKPENVSPYFRQLQQRNPPELLKDNRGYRLEGQVRDLLDTKYGERAPTIAVDRMLSDLLGKVPSEAERLFLVEAISCFRIKAFRAAIVMTWNVAYDHLEEWIICNHLASFNAQISRNFPRMAGVTVIGKEDFSQNFKEHQVIEICRSAGFLHDNIKKILNDKLTKRNMAAHPSLVEITRYQAEDVISDLVNNVILRLV